MPGKKKASKKKAGKKEKKSTGEGLTPSEVKQLQKEKDFAELSVKAAEEKIRLLHQKQRLLREQLRNQEDDTREFLATFQKKVQAAEEKNAALFLQMDKQREKFERERARTAAKFEAKVGAMSEKFTALESGSEAELHDMKQELAGLEDFRNYKAQVTLRISALEGELVDTQHRHSVHLAQLERKFIGEKAQLKKVHDDQYQSIVEDARDEALKGFEADTRAIIAANRRMTKELQFQRRQCEDLQRTSDALAVKNKELRRDAELTAQSAELAAQASVRQKRKLAKTAARAEVAEKTLRSAEFAHTRTAMQSDAKRAREVDDARVTVEGLRKLVRAKDKELRTIKNLAKSIMNQRSETEQYFLQALEQVKNEYDGPNYPGFEILLSETICLLL